MRFQLAIWWFGFGFIVFNATFNNISVISWRSVVLVEETGVPAENQRPVASHWQTLSHNLVSSTPRHERSSNSQSPGRFEKILKAFFFPPNFFQENTRISSIKKALLTISNDWISNYLDTHYCFRNHFLKKRSWSTDPTNFKNFYDYPVFVVSNKMQKTEP